jgi:hypothetical protein
MADNEARWSKQQEVYELDYANGCAAFIDNDPDQHSESIAWRQGWKDTKAKESRRKQMNASRELILRLIDETTEPNKMDPKEAMDFLASLHADIEGRIDGLKDENPELEP